MHESGSIDEMWPKRSTVKRWKIFGINVSKAKGNDFIRNEHNSRFVAMELTPIKYAPV